MCVVKTNEKVVCMEDLQDLVTSLISVNYVAFGVNDIVNEAKKELKGSKYEKELGTVKAMVGRTMEILENNNFVMREKEKFRLVV